MTSEISDLQETIKNFCTERDWDQFHSPKDLAIGLVNEASELLEHFRYKNDQECLEILKSISTRQKVEDELADVFYYVLRFSQFYGIDLVGALKTKMRKNADKYPVEKSRGSNKKYTEL